LARLIPFGTLVVFLSVGLLAAPLTRAQPPGGGTASRAESEKVAEAQPGDPQYVVTRAFDHYVVQGGWITWFVLIPLSMVALALNVQYLVTIRRQTIVPQPVIEYLDDLFEQRKYAEAIKFSADDRSVLAYVMHSGLMEARNGYAAMARAVEDAVEEQAAKLSRKIEHLNLIGSVAPMVGLFGTVYGIIGMFISISDAGGIPVMSRISHDLGTALVATFWGLLVAIPALAVFGLLRNRIEVLLGECASTADRLMTVFKPQAVEAPRSITTHHTTAAPAVAVR